MSDAELKARNENSWSAAQAGDGSDVVRPCAAASRGKRNDIMKRRARPMGGQQGLVGVP